MTKKELKLQETIKELRAEKKRYKKGFEIMICYFDSISDEEQPKVNKQLEKIGL